MTLTKIKNTPDLTIVIASVPIEFETFLRTREMQKHIKNFTVKQKKGDHRKTFSIWLTDEDPMHAFYIGKEWAKIMMQL
jgi:hypothetical protein